MVFSRTGEKMLALFYWGLPPVFISKGFTSSEKLFARVIERSLKRWHIQQHGIWEGKAVVVTETNRFSYCCHISWYDENYRGRYLTLNRMVLALKLWLLKNTLLTISKVSWCSWEFSLGKKEVKCWDMFYYSYCK